jgi:ubiquinone/menaquinone biosynthesis C-methylase UbiE
MSGRSLTGLAMRGLMGSAGTYLVNTPLVEIAEQVGLDSGHRVLEIGCGRAGLLRALDARVRFEHRPVGIDLSASMLDLARRDGAEVSGIELVGGAASRLPFADESFDLVLAAYLFKHLEDDTLFRVLLDVQRVLEPGGILLGWEFAPTSSPKLNRFHEWLLTPAVKTARLRGFGALAPYALSAGFKHVDRIQFRTPFLFPPIPRLVVMLQKSRDG